MMRECQRVPFLQAHAFADAASVLWFESFYNFRIQNEFPMPLATELIGKCSKGGFNVCTFRSSFHLFLSNLQMTRMNQDELQLIDTDYHKSQDVFATESSCGRPKVFLYELSQLTTKDTASEMELRSALQSFLGLGRPIKPFIWFKPGLDHNSTEKLKLVESKKINICDDQYDALRIVLQHQATNVSQWIRNYFVHAPGVFVSNQVHFNEIMRSWAEDPCLGRRAGQVT
jgi:hypothetical protein